MNAKKVSYITPLLLLAGGCYRAEIIPQASVPESARVAAARFVDSMAKAQHLPGFAVTVSIGRSVVFERGVGFADLAARTPATPATLFRIGSVSKLLTATALLRLVQTNRLDLDAPVSRYGDVGPTLGPITLRQLAGHLGGVRHYRGNEFLTTTAYDSLIQAIAIFAKDSLVAPPGTRYAYSSYGYNLLGAVIERAIGMRFPDVMRRYVSEPLSLDRTVADERGKAIAGRARTYSISGDTAVNAPMDDLSGRWPSGGFLSTTGDLARFGRSLLAEGLLNKASLETMFTPQRLANGDATMVGIGWRIGTDSAGRRYYHHGGSSNGGSAFLLVFPAEQMVVAMAANALGSWSEREAMTLAGLMRRP